jgi:hypothetical protein
MARSCAFAVAFVLVLLVTGCGEVARESSDRATRLQVSARVTTTIDVGGEGEVSALLFAAGAVWVTRWDGASATVLRVDPGTNEVAARIAVDGVPGWEIGGEGMAAGAGSVWVAGGTPEGRAVLERIDPATNDVVATIPLEGSSAGDVAVDDTGVWVSVFATPGTVKVVRVDPETNRVVASIPVGGDWIREIFAVEGAVLVRSLGGGDDPATAHERWTAIDLATYEIVASRRGNLEDGPFVAWDGLVWAGAGSKLVPIDAKTAQIRSNPVPVGKAIAGTSLLAGEGGLWFLAMESRATINRFDPATGGVDVDVSLGLPANPIAMALGPGSIWVLNYEGSLTRIDLHTSTAALDMTPPDWTTYGSTEWGYSVSYPATWQRAERPVAARLTEPREILSLGTFPLRHRPTNCEAFAGSARQDLGPADAFLTVQERGFDHTSEWLDFPQRPKRFAPTLSANVAGPACGDRPGTDVRWFNFTDAGRHFHVLVVAGPDAPPDLRRDAWRILNTVRLDPKVKPDWPGSG